MAEKRHISSDVIEKIKNAADIVSVMEQYLIFSKKSQSRCLALCPFHNEKTPSFNVDTEKKLYHCFGCGRGGDVVSFIMEKESLNYYYALVFLADRYGIELDQEETVENKKSREDRKKFYEINKQTAIFYYNQLLEKTGLTARQYCQSRNISLKIVKTFGIGYAPADWKGLFNHLSRLKLLTDPDIIERCGLFKKNNSGGYYDVFRDRLMFPILDVMGRVIAFGGRKLSQNPEDHSPKYINSPDTPIYKKGNHLYNLNLAKSVRSSNLVIVEGYLDAIMAYKAGIKETVAVLGTALQTVQVNLIQQYTKRVSLCFDMDKAGQEATQQAINKFKQTELDIRVVQYTKAKDPDELINKFGAEVFKEKVKKALTVMEYKSRLAKAEATVGERLDPIKYQKQVFDVLLKENNEVQIHMILRDLAEEINVPLNILIKEFSRRKSIMVNSPVAQTKQSMPVQKQKETNQYILDDEITWIYFLHLKPSLYQQYLKTVGTDKEIILMPQDFKSTEMQDLVSGVLKEIQNLNIGLDVLMRLADASDPNKVGLRDRLVEKEWNVKIDSTIPEFDQEFIRLSYRLKLEGLKRERENIIQSFVSCMEKEKEGLKEKLNACVQNISLCKEKLESL